MLAVLGACCRWLPCYCTMPVPPPNPSPRSNSSRRSGLPTIRTNPVCFDGDGTTRSPMFGLDNGTYTIGWRMDSKQIPPDQGILDCTFIVDKINPDADPSETSTHSMSRPMQRWPNSLGTTTATDSVC
jgi:hypothetical protein